MSMCRPRLLVLVQRDAAVAVHDPLGQPGRARRVDDPQRGVEGQLLEDRLLGVGDRVGPAECAVGQLVREEPGDGDRRPDAGQRLRSSATTSRRSYSLPLNR
jgi:hypothetical protein